MRFFVTKYVFHFLNLQKIISLTFYSRNSKVNEWNEVNGIIKYSLIILEQLFTEATLLAYNILMF